MPNLFVMRHGDAAGSREGDRARTLTNLGRAQARETGLRLAALEIPPAQILCSAAPRALETAEIVADVLAQAGESRKKLPFQAEGRLYLASADSMRRAAEEALAESSVELLIVAHEPGCGELVALLCEGQSSLMRYPFRTAGVRRLELTVEGQMIPGSARLTLEI